jgi:hypothetical protein
MNQIPSYIGASINQAPTITKQYRFDESNPFIHWSFNKSSPYNNKTI